MKIDSNRFMDNHIRSVKKLARYLDQSKILRFCNYYVSPVFSSLGYPPKSLEYFQRRNIDFKFSFLNYLKPVLAIIRVFGLFFCMREYRRKAEQLIKQNEFLQHQYQLKRPRRKTVESVISSGIINEVNISFLRFRDRHSMATRNDIITSLSLLSFLEVVQIVVIALLNYFIEIYYRFRFLKNEKDAFIRILNDLLKIWGLRKVLQLNKSLKIIFFFENRGFEKFFIDNNPRNTILINLGFEGRFGPLYVNYRSKNYSRVKIFVPSKWTKDLLTERFPEAEIRQAVLPNWKPYLANNNNRKTKETNKKVLVVMSIDNDGEQDLSFVCKRLSTYDIHIRVHPTQAALYKTKFGKRLDKSDENDLLKTYSAFFYFGPTYLIYKLYNSGASVLYLYQNNYKNHMSMYNIPEINLKDLNSEVVNFHLEHNITQGKKDVNIKLIREGDI